MDNIVNSAECSQWFGKKLPISQDIWKNLRLVVLKIIDGDNNDGDKVDDSRHCVDQVMVDQ